MKIDTTETLKNLKGEPINSEGEDFTFRIATCNALLAPVPAQQGADAKECKTKHLAKFGLAMKIQENDEVELKAEEVVLIEDCVALAYTPLIAGRINQIVEKK